MSSLATESIISRYKIKELIGSGGMGEVYKAVDLELGRIVALKTLLTANAGNEDAHRRFLREARAASILSHPSICTIYEVGQEGDLAYIAMQFIEGRTIENILASGALPIEDALSYALDVIDALNEAHRNGVIHRDIKPSNTIVNDRGVAVVLDFGLAKQLAGADARDEESLTLLQVTAASVIVGTIPYMSPEQLRHQELDARSDIFSFGAMLYEMLAGTLPFSGPGSIEIMNAILHQQPAPLSQLRPEVDAELDGIVRKALEKKRDDRYQSAAELKNDLLKLIRQKSYAVRGMSGAAAGGSVLSASTARTVSAGPSSSGVLSRIGSWRYILILAAAALIAGGWWLLRPRDESESYPVSSLRNVQLINWKSEAGEGRTDATLSRDGSMIAFSSMKGRKRDISILSIKGGEPVQITRDEFTNSSPIWSPDGHEIAYVSTGKGETGIWRVQTVGGTPTSMAFPGNDLKLKCWSKNGSKIYYRSNFNLFSLDVASGQITKITNFEPEHFLNASISLDVDFSMSPDENRIAYVDAKDGQSDVWMIPIDGGTPVQVTNDAAEDQTPVWHPDGKRIIYSSKRDGIFQICAAYLDGRKAQQITFGEVDSSVSDVSADGNKILYGSLKEESDIWGVKADTGEEFEVTSNVGCELWPDVSPDGRSVAFQAARDLSQGDKLKDCALLTRSIGADNRQTRLAANAINPSFSPDGSRLAFLRSSKDVWDVWTIRPTGGDERRITTRGAYIFGFSVVPYNPAQTRYYSWSPDGARIAYVSKESEQFSLWTISSDGSNDTRIVDVASAKVVYCPLWSPDGSRIAYVSAGPQAGAGEAPAAGKMVRSVRVTELASGKSETIYQTNSIVLLLGWSPSGNELLLCSVEGTSASTAKPLTLSRISIAGSANSIAAFESGYLYNTRLSPDGRSIAFVSRGEGRDNIWLVSTAGGQARKLTNNIDPRLYFSSMTWSRDGSSIYFGKESKGSFISMIDSFR